LAGSFIFATSTALRINKIPGNYALLAVFSLIIALSSIKSYYYIPYSVVIYLIACAFTLLLCRYIKFSYYKIIPYIDLCSVCIILYFIPFALNLREGKTAIIQDGKWGVISSYQAGYDSIKMQNQYGYNLFSNALNASIINSEMPLDDFLRLIIITPTKPFSNKFIDNVYCWVKNGGQIIIIADHTNLFGHQTVLSNLLKKFNVTIEPDSVFEDLTNGGTYENLFVKISGLTPCSITSGLIPRLWMHGYSEYPDYQAPSFFGNLSISNEDKKGVFMVLGSRRIGFGEISVFSDSTFFSNFAINRWSSNILLNNLNWPIESNILALISLILCVISFFYFNNISYPVSLFCLLIAPSLGFDKSIPSNNINLFFKPPINPAIPKSEERDNGFGSSQLASAFGFNISIAYSSNSSHTFADYFNNGIKYSSNKVLADNDWLTLPEFNYSDILKGDFYSDSNSFWFGQGVGDIRGSNMANFWIKCGAPISRPLYPSVLSSTTVKIIDPEGVARDHRILELSNDWLILDSRLIGKFVKGTNKILVRKEWQLGNFLKNDLALDIENQ
jgi:hypothetical protein